MGEYIHLTQERKVARKSLASPGATSMTVDSNNTSDTDSSVSNTNSSLDIGVVGQKRKKSHLMMAPTCTTLVRRSPRSNKYDGFKPMNDSDTKAIKSKVKPRKYPTIKPAMMSTEP